MQWQQPGSCVFVTNYWIYNTPLIKLYVHVNMEDTQRSQRHELPVELRTVPQNQKSHHGRGEQLGLTQADHRNRDVGPPKLQQCVANHETRGATTISKMGGPTSPETPVPPLRQMRPHPAALDAAPPKAGPGV